MDQWKYSRLYIPKVTEYRTRDETEWLNELGQQGWELVQVFPQAYRAEYLFKRKAVATPAP